MDIFKNKYLESLLEKDKILCDVFVPVSYCRLRHFESVPHMMEFLLLNYKRLKHNQRNASNVPVKERRRRRMMDVNNAGFQNSHTQKKRKKTALQMFYKEVKMHSACFSCSLHLKDTQPHLSLIKRRRNNSKRKQDGVKNES